MAKNPARITASTAHDEKKGRLGDLVVVEGSARRLPGGFEGEEACFIVAGVIVPERLYPFTKELRDGEWVLIRGYLAKRKGGGFKLRSAMFSPLDEPVLRPVSHDQSDE